MATLRQRISKTVKELTHQRTLEELGAALGYTRQAIGTWRNENIIPDPEGLENIIRSNPRESLAWEAACKILWAFVPEECRGEQPEPEPQQEL